MRKNILYPLTFLVILVVIFTGCSETPPATALPVGPTATPTTTVTIDARCSADGLPLEIAKLDSLTTDFEDVFTLAGVTPQQQLAPVVLRLQDIRREVNKLDLPECLTSLRTQTVEYMDQVVSYLTLFMGGADQVTEVNPEIAKAEGLKNVYEAERAKLLGEDFEPQPTRTPIPTPIVVSITNSGTENIPLYELPREDSQVVGSMSPGAQATAIARTADGAWLLIPINEEQFVCVKTSLVTLQGSIEQLQIFEETVNP